MATIREVAKEAGVSVGTVSRVLNNSGYVGEESRKKVEEAMRKLSYKPSMIARALNYKKSNVIGLVVPDINNPFFPEMTRAIEDVASSYGYTVMLCNSDLDPEREGKYLNVMKQNYVDGVILASQPSNLNQWLNLSIPIVAIDRVKEHAMPSVIVDNYHGARKAVKFLHEKGVKRFAHIRGPRDIVPAEERYRGFLDQMEEIGSPFVIEQSDYNLENAEQLASKFYKENPNVDGIFCSNDIIAIGFLKVALKLGIKVPENLQIMGYDGITLGKMIYPELSTVEQPIYDLGRISGELIIKLINNEVIEKQFHKLSTQIVPRGSTRL
nr:LacI family DNA-binding transcriptional regulator [Fredinandcohnia onubensis]